MRLSDIKGTRTLEVIAEVIDPIANIAEDEEAAALLKRDKLPEGVTAKQYLLQRVRKSIPALLKGHKGDIIAILAAIEGISPEEYAGSLGLKKLMTDCIDLMTDDVFTELFISAQTGDSSGSAQESTEDTEA